MLHLLDRVPGLLRVAAGLGTTALVVLVVNRLPCVVVEGFEANAWPAPGWVTVLSSSGTVQPSSAHDGSYGINDVEWAYRTDVAYGLGSKLGMWIRPESAYSGRIYLGFDAGPDGCKALVAAVNAGDLRFQENPRYGYTELAQTPVSYQAGRWYRMEVEIQQDGLAIGRLFDEDGTTLLATVRQTYDHGIGTSGVAMRSFGDISSDTITVCR